MEYDHSQTLLVQPQVSFSRINAALRSLGWRLEETPGDAPLRPDEPEFVSWTWDGRKPVLIYSYNPVAQLRVLDAATLPPAMRSAIAQALPLLDRADVDDLLFDPEPRNRLLGLWAAQETERLDLIPQAHRLSHDPNPTVAAQGRKVNQRLQRAVEAREALLINLQLLAQASQQIIRQLDNPMLTRALKPTREELAKLFDPLLVPGLLAEVERLYQRPPVADPGDAYPELVVTAANAGLLRWPNELSDKFPRGYRNVAGWMQPQWIWLTWQCHSNSQSQDGQGGGVRFDGLVWMESRWLWLPKAYRLVAQVLQQPERPPAIH